MDAGQSDRKDTAKASAKTLPKRALPLLKNLLTLVFLALVLWLLVDYAKGVNWQEVQRVLTGYSWWAIAIGACLAIGTYTAYASYDLFGRYYVKHDISKPRTMLIAFICCAFTLNLGAIIGSIGFRYKMYSQRGVSKGNITRIIGMTLVTNWLGYIMLAGVVFATGNVLMPGDWAISSLTLRLLGGLFVTVVMAYFLLCYFARNRSWTIRGQQITLPTVKIAVLQSLASHAHWMLMGAVVYVFLHDQVSYFTLLGVLLISGIAGVIAHVPSALGVLEAVFVALLGDQVPSSDLVAALIAYRAVFYLWPLSVAVLAYVSLEVIRKRRASVG
ncbi:MAG: hypothetical protein CL583_04300 [Alteromonadaceae bacterium]|mgnify:CR=1 FL=1|nr:hypothetical protein [Alteromonadaceae bacterium]|tara:strand:+ start:2378 stop:3367 length:990 start_codon:yes stop_codon:yes gene_type:complete